jgi:hypothetical protein
LQALKLNLPTMFFTAIDTAANTYSNNFLMAIPGDDDDIEDDSDTDEGWEDIEDEDFDDKLNDMDDENQVKLEDNIFDDDDDEDDDHFPDDDF